MTAPRPMPPRPMPVRPTRRARTRRRAGQSGFALIAGMVVVVLVAGVTLIALMNLTSSTARIAGRQADAERTERAVDAALETATNSLRMSADGRAGAAAGADGACVRGPGPGGGALTSTSDGVTVEVTASCATTAARTADLAAAGAGVVPRVEVVGDAYRSPPGLVDTVAWSVDCAGATTPNCYPWRAAIGIGNFTPAVAAALPTWPVALVHSTAPDVPAGNATLGFSGELDVARAALPMTDPARGGATAGISVAGRFRQGDTGAFSTVSGAGPCGLLDPAFPWFVPGSSVVDSDDPAGAPACGAPVAVASLGLDAPTAPWSAARVAEQARTVPACPTAANGVVALTPGAYDRTQTARLNDLLGGGCGGRTVWFATGSYFLDVDDAGADPLERNSLVIDDPTVRVIMGRPTGGATTAAAAAATFPEACDRSADGVSVTLSPRTSLRHERGLLAVCDRTASGASTDLPPAVWQTGVADGGWAASPQGAIGFGARTTVEGDAVAGPDDVVDPGATGVIDDRLGGSSSRCTVARDGTCRTTVTVDAAGFRSGAAPPAPLAAQPVASLDVVFRGAVGTSFGDGFVHSVTTGESATAVSLYRAGSDDPLCTAVFGAVPDPRSDALTNTLAFDLFAPTTVAAPGTERCADLRAWVGVTRGDLHDARVVVDITTFAGFHKGAVDHVTTSRIDGLELRAGWDLVPTRATAAGGFTDADAVTAADGRSATFSLRCSNRDCPTGTASVTGTGLDNTTSPWVPTDGPLSSAALIVTGDTSLRQKFTDGAKFDRSGIPDVTDASTLRAVVALADGRTCSASWPQVPLFGHGLYLDLLDAPGDCRDRLTSARDLIGASATVEVYLQRNEFDKTTGNERTFFARIDGVRISTVTAGSYTGPTAPHRLTADAAGAATAAGSRAVATVAGAWSTPRATLNVRWGGVPATAADGSEPPLLRGRTVVGALGSSVGSGGRAGVVCCTGTRAAERLVTLTATVVEGGTRRPGGSATVRISDRNGTGAGLTVESWSLPGTP